MSFSQKKKRSILPVAGGFIEEEFILESQKSKTNKSLLDFKSPKLSRLKNFIKSPVQKSYNKYKQFQDNDDDNSLSESKSHGENPIKRQSVDSQNIDLSNDSTINHESKDISQTSLLTTISTVPPDSYPISPCFDSLPCFVDEMAMPNHLSALSKSVKSDCINVAHASAAGEFSDKNIRLKCSSFKESMSHERPMVKSASIGVLFDPKASDPLIDADENASIDKVDGTNNNVVASSGDSKATRWNPTAVDIETTNLMLLSLDDHIKNAKEKIFKELSMKDQMVDKLISNFSINSSDTKSSKKICKEFEVKNKNAEKYLEKSQMELEQLEFKRLIVSQEGIPWGVNPADYVKNINKKDRNKKKAAPEMKQSPGSISKFLKSNSQKSASAENISRLINDQKSTENKFSKSWLPKPDDLNKSKDFSSKTRISDDSSKHLLPVESTGSPKVIYTIQNLKKSGSGGANSAISLDQQYGDKASIPRKSKSNSMSSGTGKEQPHEHMDLHESPKNQNPSVTSFEEVKSEDHSYARFLSLQNEISFLKNELHEVRSGFHRFQCETDNLRLDMNTNSELNSQKMQNSIERVDRLERMLDLLRQQCQIEFCTWKDDFRNLEEKLDYRLTTTRRDLQDNIDSCNNSISLVEKRTDQLPFMSNRANKNDVKVITDHLCNLVVSLIAFIMLLLSSGFHLLIRFLNIGATLCRHRNMLLPPLIIGSALIIVSIKWSLWNKFCALLSDSGYFPNFVAGP